MDTKSLGDAKSIASRRTAATSVGNTTNKLNALADNFNNFYGDLEEETRIRKQGEDKRVSRIERELGKIERVIATETKRRIEASKALQTMFEGHLVKVQGDFKEEMRVTYEPLQAQIDALVGRVEQLEQRMEATALLPAKWPRHRMILLRSTLSVPLHDPSDSGTNCRCGVPVCGRRPPACTCDQLAQGTHAGSVRM